MEKENNELNLEGILQRFSPRSYPGRIYGMYDWEKNKWVINEAFCKEHGIIVKNKKNE